MCRAIRRIVGDFQRRIEADGKDGGGIPVRRQSERPGRDTAPGRPTRSVSLLPLRP
jgi:hypothetical protein